MTSEASRETVLRTTAHVCEHIVPQCELLAELYPQYGIKFAFKCVTAKDAPPQHLRLSFGPAPLEDGQFPGTESEQVSFSFPADVPVGERVTLRALEGKYPEWRGLINTVPKNTKEIWLNPELLSRVASVKRYYGEGLGLSFSGKTGVVHLRHRESDHPKPELFGAVMPMIVKAGE